MDDVELLWEYARSGSSEIFARIAARYIDLIYSAALRQVRDPNMADDVTQAVLIILMNKAGSMPKGTILPGWLLKATRYASLDAKRLEARRRRNERQAAAARAGREAEEAGWEQMAPILDEALLKLRTRDRDVIVMRYLLGKSAEEIAWVMRISEEAARQRISRALRRLRGFFGQRGVKVMEAGLASAIGAHAVQAAPAPVQAAAAALAASSSSALAAPPSMIAQGAAQEMLWAQVRTGAMAAACGVIAVGLASAVVYAAFLSPTSPLARSAQAPSAVAGRIPSSVTPLIWAAQNNDLAAAREILAAGADVSAVSTDGNNTTALLYALAHWNDASHELVQLLIENGADVNVRHGTAGYTALMRAVRYKSPGNVGLLLANGADPHLADRQGRNALDWAEEDGDTQMIELLRGE